MKGGLSEVLLKALENDCRVRMMYTIQGSAALSGDSEGKMKMAILTFVTLFLSKETHNGGEHFHICFH